ncbi:DUF7097 family protein [Halorientalis regularis]|jgi:hypothetical protein|uniref:Uncharacterized protein n=1 Tax=Halorientalis regularis TaxID=660518 RepID=A0A1G7J2B1_9EURY|nr:hypothetical protein [Halorientalis regularis]SDF19015.1 hypothetical protein SAMN05216218_104178 [Halorientalis regularis]
MEKTPTGTAVGVDDPYVHVDRCDHLTDAGKCRFAVEQGDRDPAFADARSAEDFQCPVAGDLDEEGLTGPWEWADCPHFRCRDHERECARCGLEARRLAHSDERPLLEEHHLSYTDSAEEDGDPSHEIAVVLCRWCHAKVHDSWARIDDDVNPDAEAIAEAESRRAREQDELSFSSAAERFDRDG